MVLLFESRHGCLLTRAEGIGLPLGVGARGIRGVQLRASFVNTANQEGDTIGSGHRLALAAFVALTEVDGDVGDGLSDGLHSHRLVEVEGVVLRLHTTVVNQDAGVAHDTTHGTSNMAVDFDEFLAALRSHLELG